MQACAPWTFSGSLQASGRETSTCGLNLLRLLLMPRIASNRPREKVMSKISNSGQFIEQVLLHALP
jgi:hypothetical protein